MINILYNDLKTLITNNQLVPEEQYRITDYVTTVSKANYTSAGYKFDIVVTALTTNTLYEYATLMANATETYFDANALLLYNIKYNVNNIIPDYYNDWVDVNGKGCIYYMSDDKGNEAPFDFKNIKFYGKFLFNNTLDGTDTSQTVSKYNSVKEVIDDDTFNIPQVSFNNECNNISIDINAIQVSLTECSNLQMGKSCSNCEFSEVSNVVIGNDFVNSELTFINGGEIGNNNNGIIATNQTNLIVKDNNTSVTLGGGSNGVIIDSNNTNVTIGTNAKDIYINGSKTVDLGNNIEQFNISSSYNMTVADDCKLFTLNNTNHLTATTGCEGINTISNDYITLTEAVKNVTISGGLTNLILDGTKLIGTDAKVITKQDEKVVVVNEQTNSEVVLTEDGTTTSNPNSYITDSPSDGFVYGRKDGEWEQIDTSGGGITDAPLDNKTYGRKDGEWEQIDTSGGGTLSTTWSALKALRDGRTLVPGQKYRITDYVCTTTTTNTRSVGNLFDVVVTALDENVLSENAGATYHAGDTYFTSNNAKLESWKLKYCIDNDTSRFAWANTVSGKGVIYYMKDNYNNECPYDFKNIQYLKNSVWVYTFGGTTDNSLTGNSVGNTIKESISSFKLSLNSNTFGNGCQYNTFGDNCQYNTFGDNCYINTFGNGCQYNTFGNSCSSNTFDNGCQYNTFVNNCFSNTFGNYCYNNTFGDYCSFNTFGNNCYYNKFYHGPSGTTLKNFIRYVVLEDGVRYNNFYSTLTTISDNYLQRIRIKGLDNTTPLSTIINLSTANTNYEWVIAKNLSGVIKQYCPENLVP